jgi:ubiquinone/menaquinone biosynthesis C-methylase UbiE
MTNSLSFDRAADFYDKTRDLPEPVATRGIQAILDAAGAGARILDAGTGTGRVSVPLLKRGADLFGVDLSTRMMSHLREKFPSARLAQADVSQLPFPGKIFDAVLTCHVMHLVGPWREALLEYRRGLKPLGVYINARTERVGESVHEQVRSHWRNLIKGYGIQSQRPGVRDDKDLHEALISMGAIVTPVEVVRYPRSYVVRELIEEIASRTHSHTWDVPEEVLEKSLDDLKAWALSKYGDLDKVYEEEARFILDITRF